jgi:hypothetical protein
VDVLAIFALNRVVATEDQQRQENNRRAQEFLRSVRRDAGEAEADWARRAALDLLISAGSLMDRRSHDQLMSLVDRRPWSPETDVVVASHCSAELAAERLAQLRREEGGNGPEAS